MSNQQRHEEAVLLKISSSTDTKKLASSIVLHYQENKERNIILRVIGAGALNQAIKAVIISNRTFVGQGAILAIIPSFNEIEAEQITSIELRIRVIQL